MIRTRMARRLFLITVLGEGGLVEGLPPEKAAIAEEIINRHCYGT